MATGNYQRGLPIQFESVSAVTATNSVDVGTVKTFNGEDYIYVYNGGATTLSVQQGASVLSAGSGYTVTVSSTTMVGFFFGICKHTDIPAASYGWVITRGFAKVSAASNTGVTAGKWLCVGDNGGCAEAIGTQTAPVFGQAMITTISGGSAFMFVRCFGT